MCAFHVFKKKNILKVFQETSEVRQVDTNYFSLLGFPRYGSRTGVPSGESGRGTSKQSYAKMALVPSSMDSCSPMMTCTRATPTTTGPPRA